MSRTNEASEPPASSALRDPWARYGLALLLVCLVLLGVGLVRGPAETVGAIRDAGARRDAAALARLVDEEALGHSLGRMVLQQMGGAMTDDRTKDKELLKQFVVAGAMTQSLVRTLIAPEGLEALASGQIGPRLSPDRPVAQRVAVEWISFSLAKATLVSATGDDLMVLRFQRQRLSWRLVGVEPPPAPVALPAPGGRPVAPSRP
ncbi:MAG: DUF2939 domain-containing protein [Burkholderiaceae bacterium]|nr:DUF2939 domain-containing protein [Burkholderiaceae bacterium]